MPKTSDDYQLFNVRLPAGTVERIQRYRDHLNQTQPGIEASASTAARMLLSALWSKSRKKWEFARGRRSDPSAALRAFA